MMRTFLLVVLAASLPALASSGWERLGMTKAKVRLDRDVIPVTIKDGTFKKLKVKVRDNGLRILDMKVFFGDGSVHDVQIRKVIKQGGETRVIDLPGRKRIIKKTDFLLDSFQFRKE